jgi:hypothetical protein
MAVININIKYLIKTVNVQTPADIEKVSIEIASALVNATASIEESLKSDSDKSEQQSSDRQELK